ncbi:MAG: hypothetical protein IT162_05585 [Bryobacterales bacterium]|nr:hypothetical protein [Bryobacterales bacterium]
MLQHLSPARTVPALLLALTPAILTAEIQTMHEDSARGDSGSVTLRLRSRTILDRGLLTALGTGNAPVMQSNELWQHGHSSPQLLRVINPSFGCKLFGGGKLTRKETGNTMLCLTDTVKIEVVAAPDPAPNCQPDTGNCYSARALNGMLKVGDLVITRKQKPGAGAFTNGHLFGDLRGDAFNCAADAVAGPRKAKVLVNAENYLETMMDILNKFNPVRKSEEVYSMSARQTLECLKMEVMRNIASESGSGSAADLDTMWVFEMVDPAGFIWNSLDPVAGNGSADTVVKDFPTGNLKPAEIMTQAVFRPHTAARSANFDFRLLRNGDEKLLFRDLSVYSAGSTSPRFKRRINPGGNFTICRNNEQTGQPECVPVPDLLKPLKVPEARCCNVKGHGKHH